MSPTNSNKQSRKNIAQRALAFSIASSHDLSDDSEWRARNKENPYKKLGKFLKTRKKHCSHPL